MKGRPQQVTPRASSSARARLTERLGVRRGEIEEAVLARVRAIADPREVSDPRYGEGLTTAVSAALDYGLEGLESSEEHPPDVPVALIAQARLAARNGVGIGVVLRRYFAGYTLLDAFLVQEATELGLSGAPLKAVLRALSLAFDRLVVVAGEEHAREARPSSPASAESRRVRLVRRLLAGEPTDAAELRYPFEVHHLGLVAVGPGGEDVVEEIASAVGRRRLVVRPDGNTVWAWFGGTGPLEAGELCGLAARSAPGGAAVAIGEAAEGTAGWRLTHRQAAAALPLAERGEDRVARYIDVALLAATVGDDLLAASLRRFYLTPLERGRDGGRIARETLRAYLKADRNVSSAAAALGVSRNTVTSRLRAIETAIGRPLRSCAAEFDIALRLDETA
jgi:hypothetical protein